jgi:hypothetical protein
MISIARLVSKKNLKVLILLGGFLVLAELGLRAAGYFYLARFYAQQFEAAANGLDGINIVCLGESSTSGLGVEWKDSYPKQLETMLREFYGTSKIRVIVPVHVGQNSSQVSNRIADYIQLYRPKLIVAMMGYNNEWSLAESHIGQFLPASSISGWKVRTLIALDGLRLFKVIRYGYHSVFSGDSSSARDRLVLLGHPELVRYPPADWVYDFAAANKPAFVALWKSDTRHVFEAAKAQHVGAVLMTYHINPTYLSNDDFVTLADEEKVPLVRNDAPFRELVDKGTVSRYLTSDHWHPNRFGYAIIATNLFREIVHENLLGLGGTETEATQPPVNIDDAEQFSIYPVPNGIDFKSTDHEKFIGEGWSGQEGFFRWTDSTKADILFALATARYDKLEMKLRPFLLRGQLDMQRLVIKLNGRPIATLELRDPNPKVYSVELPSEILSRKNVLQFELPDARSPKELKVSPDSRQLGIAMEWLRLQ